MGVYGLSMSGCLSRVVYPKRSLLHLGHFFPQFSVFVLFAHISKSNKISTSAPHKSNDNDSEEGKEDHIEWQGKDLAS